MTVKTSISLPDVQAEYAKAQVERGLFPSMSALVQHSLEVLRQKEEAERLERQALKVLLEERRAGRFVDSETFKSRSTSSLTEAARKYALDN